MSEQSIYEIQVGMRVHSPGDISGMVDFRDPEGAAAFRVSRDWGGYIWRRAETLTPDWGHPGTTGLLLQQYRDRSGHAHAVIVWSEAVGVWVVDPDPYALGNDAKGSGKTEGEAIRDALTRLTNAEKAVAAAYPDGVPEDVFGTGRVSATSAEPKPQPAPHAGFVVAHFTHDDHNRKHRVVINRASGRVDVEWYAGEDALGNARWNREHCDVADGTTWVEIVALAIVEHYEAERERPTVTARIEDGGAARVIAAVKSMDAQTTASELRSALLLRAAECKLLYTDADADPVDRARVLGKAVAYKHAAEIVSDILGTEA